MKKQNRHIQAGISFFLAILLICGTFSHFIYFKVQQYSIKQEIKQKLKREIPKKELISFTFSISSLNKKVDFFDKNEFRYKGKMYDIVYQETQNNTIILLCVSDEQETVLFAQLDKLVQQQSKNSQEKNRQLFKLLNFQFIYTDYIDFTIHTIIHSKQLSQYNYSVKTWNTKIELPPPQLLFTINQF